MILVDDERLTLNYLVKMLQEFNEFQVVGSYQNPLLALKEIHKIKPDVVFLDVEMPELNGIETSEKIFRILPDTDIVFVTAFDEYAVKAFELNALDYMLKPVQRDRLKKTLDRLIEGRKNRTLTSLVTPGKIHCFQSLQIEVSPGKTESIRWRTSKAQELFAYLIHRKGQPVRKDTLIDLFWPDVEWKKAYDQLYTTIYQIRKTLHQLEIGVQITNFDEGYLLDLNGVFLDVEEWKKDLQKAPPLNLDTLDEHLRLLDLYRGDYLAEYDYWWAEGERQRLRRIWFLHAIKVAQFLEKKDKIREALGLYHHIQQFLPQVEDIYFSLMRLYDKLGERDSVETQYNSLTHMLSEELDVEPMSTVQNWYQSWKEHQINREHQR